MPVRTVVLQNFPGDMCFRSRGYAGGGAVGVGVLKLLWQRQGKCGSGLALLFLECGAPLFWSFHLSLLSLFVVIKSFWRQASNLELEPNDRPASLPSKAFSYARYPSALAFFGSTKWIQ
jgi:hypothetical protein